ncbi:DUF4136 domain-containing protein [Herbaspirillum lusitanum]|uniref:DUF4136 domain-containing protein n=1 Tax=Herbaspirillum lusitanum TaxID=213312 RepID=A0ABW9A240_9BURK
MKRWFKLLVLSSALMLSGCASFVESDVTAFHAWPKDMQGKSYVFSAPPERTNNLEYLNYEQLIRQELQVLGFKETQERKSADLTVAFQYGMSTENIVVTQPVDPFFYGQPYGAWGRFGPYRRPYYAPFGPFYDPFFYGPQQTTSYPVFIRRLQIGIARADSGQQLYDVIVDSEGRSSGLAGAMPYMVRSAFADFPGPSGVARHIKLKVEENGKVISRLPPQ